MITVKDLSKKFGNITAVDHISFEIKEGQIFGFLGPNGAGKTTTIRMLATLIKPTSGTITIDGNDISKNAEYTRSIIGILTETPGMYEKISAYENLNYFSGFYNMEEATRKRNIEKFLRMFDLWERRESLVSTYSKGMKQKLALARALVHEPKILFLDEPTSALDPESAYMVRNFIESLKDEKTTVFLCTHNLEEASNLSDLVCIIKNKIIRVSTLEELQKNKKGKRIEIILANDSGKYLEMLRSYPGIEHLESKDNKIMLSLENPEKINPVIIKDLVDSGAEIIFFNEIQASLEEIYLDLIKCE